MPGDDFSAEIDFPGVVPNANPGGIPLEDATDRARRSLELDALKQEADAKLRQSKDDDLAERIRAETTRMIESVLKAQLGEPRAATTIEVEHIAMLRAQADAFEQMGAWAEEARISVANEGDLALSAAERRRWHVLQCVGSASMENNRWFTFSDLDRLVGWLENGETPTKDA